MITNPFRMLDGLQVGDMLRGLAEQSAAEKRLKQMVLSYRELLTDPRYQEIRKELEASLGEQLRLLVKEASKCRHCAPRAERIRLLDEVVNQPVQVVWYANQARQAEESSNGE